jgi:hypothetical protein
MERLFSPCTRLYDLLESQGRHSGLGGRPEPLELNLNISTEDLLSAKRAYSYADLHGILLGNRNTFAWLTSHAFVASHVDSGMCVWLQLHDSYRFKFSTDGKGMIAFARSSEHLLEICDIVLRLLAASAVHSVILQKHGYCNGAMINTPGLVFLMKQCQSLKVLSLNRLEMDENHCRVLGAYSRPDLEIVPL